MKNENLHAGNREQLRKKFLKNNFKGFNQTDILELLLSYALPNSDFKLLAQSLISRYKNITNICNADTQELMRSTSMSELSVVLIKMIPFLAREYIKKLTPPKYSSIKEKRLDMDFVCKYFISQFICDTDEKFRIAALNERMKIVNCKVLSEGTRSGLNFNIRKIIEFSCQNNSYLLIFAHNHPDGNPSPSQEDISTTKILCTSLKSVGIIVLDHIIVSGNKAFSMKEHNILP